MAKGQGDLAQPTGGGGFLSLGRKILPPPYLSRPVGPRRPQLVKPGSDTRQKSRPFFCQKHAYIINYHGEIQDLP